MKAIQITVNGQSREFPGDLSVRALLEQLGYTDDFVAVAINQECILRRHYTSQAIQPGDAVEILAPMAGG